MRITLLVAAAAVCAFAATAGAGTYSWDGGSSSTSSWQTASNWRSDTIPPLTGNHDIHVRAADLVGTTTTANWDYSSSTASYGLFDIVSNASYAMTLQKSGAGSFTATGRLSLTGYSSTKVSTLDADAAMTITGLSVYSYGDVDVAASVTVDCNASMLVDALNGITQCVKLGSGSLTPDWISAMAGNAAGEHARLLVAGGTFAASGTSPSLTVEAADTVDADATLEFDAGTLTPVQLNIYGGNPSSGGLALFDFDGGTLSGLDRLAMVGLSTIDAEDDITVNGELVVTVNGGDNFATEATLDAQDVSVEKIEVGGSQACKLIVTGNVATDGSP